tara:strand:+ start:334 stop:549 length:216 start_codon:yes stop_codon:yes gene_type:complete
MAINHCKSYGIYAKYKSLDAGLRGPATHTFACEKKKADDELFIAAIKQRASKQRFAAYSKSSFSQSGACYF